MTDLRRRLALMLGTLAITASPAQAAEQIELRLGNVQAIISVAQLRQYSRTGRAEGDLAAYLNLLAPPARQAIQNGLTRPINVDGAMLGRLLQTPLASELLLRLGSFLRTTTGDNGSAALRQTLTGLLASQQPLTPLELIEQFPSPRLTIDLTQGIALAREVARLFPERERLFADLRQVLARRPDPPTGTVPIAVPVESGREDRSYPVKVQELDWVDPTRRRPVPTTLYLPQGRAFPPVVLLSHGLGEDRLSFGYLGRFLASQGFLVAIPEHVGSNATVSRSLFNGEVRDQSAEELLDRPRDLTFVLDQMGADPQLRSAANLNRVAVIGHSYGGYTGLALAGARLNRPRLESFCTNPTRRTSSLNLAAAFQCRALDLDPQQQLTADPRIRAVIALNPPLSHWFGPEGLATVRLPVLVLGSSNDIFVPVADEQIEPFQWLGSPRKYLALLENGTHFSVMDAGAPGSQMQLPSDMVGPDPAIAHHYVEQLSLVFLRRYLNEERIDTPDLDTDFGRRLSQTAMPLYLLDRWPEQLPIPSAQ